jgi:hypothetical protein
MKTVVYRQYGGPEEPDRAATDFQPVYGEHE